MPKGGSPFATFLIVGPTCFFLGILFSLFPYDYYVLWASPPPQNTTTVPEPYLSLLTRQPSTSSYAAAAATTTTTDLREPYLALLESHLRFLHASPPLISRIMHIVIATGLIGVTMKLYKPSEANMLFDGASLVLYICGVVVYITNIIKGLRVVTQGVYEDAVSTPVGQGAGASGEPINREDSLKVLAASNTILALVLVGVLVLQAGQWYAQKKEAAEIEEMDRVAEEKRAAREKGGSGRGVPGVQAGAGGVAGGTTSKGDNGGGGGGGGGGGSGSGEKKKQ